jgi:iron(III) transport system substrate-binding protein
MHGEPVVEAWLTALRDNDLRLYDGNAAVVQALAKAEIDVGLTDSDDALVAKDRDWPVAYLHEDPQGQAPQGVPALPAGGAIVIPNTVAIVAGTQRRALAEQLAAFLLSARCEQLLAESDAKTISIRDGTPLPSPATLDPAALIEAMPRADALVRKVLGPT